jgi:gentisate 1,2-dioxygenase
MENAMAATDRISAQPGSTDEAIRKAWREAHVQPLWENTAAHNAQKHKERAYVWQWSVMRPLITDVLAMKSLASIERRVLTLVPPERDDHTTTNLTTALQILKPGETARPHRHSMNALRFVLDGNGAATLVNGRSCLMEEGDLVITPGMTWHEHVHHGDAPIVWLDALDAPLHRYLGTDLFQPGPAIDVENSADDSAFAAPNVVPELAEAQPAYSPVFRYPWSATAKAVHAAPVGKDGARRVRYVNPMTGGAVMTLLDCYLTELDPRVPTTPYRTTSNAVCAVVEGHGSSQVGDDTLSWGPKDIISLPHGNWISHRAEGGSARLFIVTDREVLRRLDLLTEEYGNRVAS